MAAIVSGGRGPSQRSVLRRRLSSSPLRPKFSCLQNSAANFAATVCSYFQHGKEEYYLSWVWSQRIGCSVRRPVTHKKDDVAIQKWRNVSPVGQPIPGTRFIAFKVPLKGAINQRLTPNQKFTPKDLIAAMKALNVELGLIIDLAYTQRYYNTKDLPKTVEYKKLYTAGLQVPDDDTILQFKKWVRKFLWENADNEKLIGVHCTNGINRTGYLICRYLIDVEGWDPETAIQAFGEARGHHMDGDIYLTDLRTQPMRSNLGMNIWDDVEIPLPDEMDGRIGRFPSEEFPRPEKRLRVYEDGHPHNDLPGQIQLREFDFINKGPGQRRKPYNDVQFQEDLQSLMQIRERRFPEPQFYDDYQEERHREDLDFAVRDSEEWKRPFPDHRFYNNLESAPPGDRVSRGRGQRQRHFPESGMPTDMQINRGHGQRQRLFYDQQSNDEFQSRMQLKDQPFLNMGRGQRMRLFHDCPPRDDIQSPVGDFEFVSRGQGQRMRPFFDRQHDNELQREMALEDFEDRDSEPRCRSFHDHQSYEDFSEPAQPTHFVDSGPEQRMRPFNNHSPCDEVSYEGYLERRQPLPSREHFPDSPVFCRDDVSDKEDYNRNYRDDRPKDYRRVCLSDGINKGGKSRFAPYPSHPMHHPSSEHEEVSSASADYGREPQREISREMDRGKRLPVVTIDYNYGLPLDYAPEEEDRTHYDLPSRERYIWN